MPIAVTMTPEVRFSGTKKKPRKERRDVLGLLDRCLSFGKR